LIQLLLEENWKVIIQKQNNSSGFKFEAFSWFPNALIMAISMLTTCILYKIGIYI